ncbi:MAG: helix-turn-helix domain-containing protein [Parcubacteria group bacterium]|jgi:sugar-specific transcriptional regulator TrmB
MYEQSLIQIGLNYTQSLVYEILIKNGSLSARKIVTKTPFKRGLVYKTLDDLLKLEVIEKTEPEHSIAIFQAKHPLSLRNLAEKREQKAKDAKLALDGMISSIISDYNLVSGRPGVLFYEGLDGIKKVLDDSLESKTEICTYADMEVVVKYIDKINREYVKKRGKLGLKKKVIMLDNDFARKYMKNYYNEVTEVRFIDYKLFSFSPLMEIYDNTVSYVTLEEKNKIGVIVKNKEIYQMHKSLFEFNWKNSKTLSELN